MPSVATGLSVGDRTEAGLSVGDRREAVGGVGDGLERGERSLKG